MKKQSNFLISTISAAALLITAVLSVVIYQSQIIERFRQSTKETLRDSAIEQSVTFKRIVDGQYESLEVASQLLENTKEEGNAETVYF